MDPPAPRARTTARGYPAGRRGEEIPLESRIIAVADAFEAMTGSPPYRDSISTAEALAELRRSAARQFDPACVEALAAAVVQQPGDHVPERLSPPDVPAQPARKQIVPASKRARATGARQAGNFRQAIQTTS